MTRAIGSWRRTWGAVAYTTVRNWMFKDFPKIAKKIGGDELHGVGGLKVRDPERALADHIVGLMSEAEAALGTMEQYGNRRTAAPEYLSLRKR